MYGRHIRNCTAGIYGIVLQAYESVGDLEKQADQVVPLQSKLELAINERDAAIAKAEGLTPRPGVRAFEGLSPEGCKQLGAALDAHRFCILVCHDGVLLFILGVFASCGLQRHSWHFMRSNCKLSQTTGRESLQEQEQNNIMADFNKLLCVVC